MKYIVECYDIVMDKKITFISDGYELPKNGFWSFDYEQWRWYLVSISRIEPIGVIE